MGKHRVGEKVTVVDCAAEVDRTSRVQDVLVSAGAGLRIRASLPIMSEQGTVRCDGWFGFGQGCCTVGG